MRIPTATEIAMARALGQRLSRYRGQTGSLSIKEPLEIPAGAFELLMDILDAMAAGRAVAIVRENAELTTVQAAAVLHVSRPYFIKLLDEGAIPHRKVGKHRRILLEDVMAYKNRINKQREAVLDQLVADAQLNDMGYGKP